MKRKIAAIDIGTTKVCTIMGTLDSSAGLRILGVGVAPSRGVEKALIANVNQARESIYQSIKKAEMMSGGRIDSAFIGVTGNHINSINKKGTVAITGSNQKVRPEDLKRAINVALDIRTPAERKSLHVVPRSYTLDGQEVKDPVGMHGYELNIEAAVACVQNLTKCVQGIGITVEDLVLDPLASAEAVLGNEEKRSGVLVADIGGRTTDIAVIKDSDLYHTSVLPVGGQHITADISAAFGLPVEMAEEMKKKYNSFIPEKSQTGQLADGGGANASYKDLTDVIGARLEEMIRMIMLELEGEDLETLIPAGIVITGGCAKMSGIAEMAHYITHLPVRVGAPTTLNGVSSSQLADPAYATSVGLILWKMKDQNLFESKGMRGVFSPLVELFR